MILYLHRSMGDPLRKWEFSRKNGTVGTYENVDSIAKADFLVRVWLPNPLGDAPNYFEGLQKNCMKAYQLPLCSEIRDSGNLLSS